MDRKVFYSALFVFLFAGVAFAATQEGDAPAQNFDLTTYAGIAGLTAFLIEMAKRFAESWMKGKELLFALLLPLVIGVVVKAVGISFGDTLWPNHLVALVMASVGSGLLHDKVAKAFAKKESAKPANANP